VSCTATDAIGNHIAKDIPVSVLDTTPPDITVPGAKTIDAANPAGAPYDFTVLATDNYDLDVAVSCTSQSGDQFPLDATTVVACTAVDSNGNEASKSFSVTVVDATPPTLAGIAPVTAEATSAAGAPVTFGVTAEDIVDGAIAASCTHTSGTTFALGDTTVTCTATDSHGNTGSDSFVVGVVDTTPPTLAGLQDKSKEANGMNGAAVSFAPTASDVVDGAVTPVCNPGSGSTFPVGTTTVSCTATDAHGNAATGTFQVTILEGTPPALSLPADISVKAKSAQGTIVTYSASATDAVDGSVAISCDPPSGTKFPVGTTTVTCTASDAAGNVRIGTFKVSVTYQWSGVKSPVGSGSGGSTTQSTSTPTAKLGSTLAVKFSLVGESAGIIDATGKVYVAKLDSAGNAGAESAAMSTSNAVAGNLFRYDATSDQYIFNLNTKSLALGAWQIRIDLGDGVTRACQVSLVK
jgi:hypothetical protein